MIGEEKGSVAISGRSSHKMTGLLYIGVCQVKLQKMNTLISLDGKRNYNVNLDGAIGKTKY